MEKNQSEQQTPRDIPTHKDPEKTKPIQDPSLKPSSENPRDPKKDNREIKS